MSEKEAYYKADLVSIDAWKEDGGWTWNASYTVERDIIMADSAITARKVVKMLRKRDFLTQASKGKVRVEMGLWPLVEVQLKSNRMPLYALIFNETPCGHK